ncbi:antirestriction protein [Vitreoscilla massiliensis]|uniref:Antirestriction protein n=1 Tax=Vitreoscilla massiliensis TaxID=1689272 RepID=A0ABY4E0I1_9NEIS|nr:antirestriction protein [Vitreoscilla massiliensis]UOO88305.1 antirestriction protein [Vitreoscilla massiliensis]
MSDIQTNKETLSQVSTNTNVLATTPINKTQCAIGQRLYFLPHYLGRAHAVFQNCLFYLAKQFLEPYDGGYWEFYHLSKGGFVMALDDDNTITVNSPNGSSATVDAETASIVVSLMTLSDLSFNLQTDSDELHKVITSFHALRDFALEHPSSNTILKLID